MTEKENEGKLFVVSTPIGHLGDITHRAVKVLKGVDEIIAEDTRRSQKLLNYYEINTPFTRSYYEGVNENRVQWFCSRLRKGVELALVSNAGTPLISDPGFRLVRAAIRAEVRVVPVPGPSAVTAALSVSGQPTDSFIFKGMMPKKKGRKKKTMEELKTERTTVVFYESPHRIGETLKAFSEILPHRRMTVCRELTKQHEEILEGECGEIAKRLKEKGTTKGEYTLVVDGASEREIESWRRAKYEEVSVEDQVKGMQLLERIDKKEAMKRVARLRGTTKREIYKKIERD